MASTDEGTVAQEKEKEADRHRKAADDALQQLDWVIGYLHGIGKLTIARVLATNRGEIRRELLHRNEEPLPSQTTNQT